MRNIESGDFLINTVERILKLIKDKGITEKQFVNDIGLNRSAFTDWKSGKSKSYRTHAVKISEYLNTSVAYLLCESEDSILPDKKDAPPTIEDARKIYNALLDNGIVKPGEKLNRRQLEFLMEFFKNSKDFIRFNLDNRNE